MDLSKRIRRGFAAWLAVFLAVTEAAGAGSVLPGTGFRERQCAEKAIRHVLLPHFETMGAERRTQVGERCFSHVLLGIAKERAFPYSRSGPCPEEIRFENSFCGSCPDGFGVVNRLYGPCAGLMSVENSYCGSSPGEIRFENSFCGSCPDGFGVVNRLYGPWDSGRPAGEKAGAKQPFRITAKWGWAGSAVALAAGVAGYIMKVRADRAYDRYMDTVVPETMDRYFEEAVRYDKISGVCYTFGETCLVFSLVVFIKTVGAE